MHTLTNKMLQRVNFKLAEAIQQRKKFPPRGARTTAYALCINRISRLQTISNYLEARVKRG